MKFFMKLIISLFILLSISSVALSATYYIKNGGNNGLDGLSDGNAWETITYVNSQNFANDDVLCFKRGSTFTDATLTLNSTAVGRSGIVIQDYGTGDKPRIDGNSVRPIVIEKALVNLTVKNIDISGSDAVGFSRCQLKYIDGLIVDGLDYNGHTGSSVYQRTNCLNVVEVDGDIEIKNCHIYNIYKDTFYNTLVAWIDLDAHGILLWYPGDGNVKLTGTVNIHDNYIHDVYADCIQTGGVHTTTNIYNNTLDRFGENALDLKYSRYSEVYNNDISHNDFGLHHGGGYYGCSVIASGGASQWTSAYKSRDNIIRDNYIHDCKWEGIAGIGSDGQVYRNHFKDIGTHRFDNDMKVFNNLFESTTPIANEITYPGTAYEFDWSTRYVGIMASGARIPSDANNILIYNNTFYISSSNHLYGLASQTISSVVGAIIKNNIIYMTRNSASVFPLYIEDYDNSGNLPIAQYNNLYGVHINRVTIEETPGAARVTYDSAEQAAWRTAGHTGGLFSDPVFVAPGSNDLTLQTTSPAIDAGVNLGVDYDDALDPDSTWPDGVATLDQDLYGDGWEMGAYVFETTQADPPILSGGGMTFHEKGVRGVWNKNGIGIK